MESVVQFGFEIIPLRTLLYMSLWINFWNNQWNFLYPYEMHRSYQPRPLHALQRLVPIRQKSHLEHRTLRYRYRRRLSGVERNYGQFFTAAHQFLTRTTCRCNETNLAPDIWALRQNTEKATVDTSATMHQTTPWATIYNQT